MLSFMSSQLCLRCLGDWTESLWCGSLNGVDAPSCTGELCSYRIGTDRGVLIPTNYLSNVIFNVLQETSNGSDVCQL